MFFGAKKLVDTAKKIYIVGHINPDGDSIGSAYALCNALKNIGKEANVIMTKYSDSFAFLPGIEEDRVEVINELEYDLLICVDSSSKERLDISLEDYNKANKVILIDHHKQTEDYADVICRAEELPATCELIYNFLEYMQIELDKKISTFLYCGLLTDTGSFNYSSTKPSTLKIAAELLEQDIDFAYICDKLFHSMKEAKLKLIGKTIDNMEVYFDRKVRYSYIDYETISSLLLNEEDAEGMTNYLRNVEGTQVAVYIRQKSGGEYKVSLRSRENVDVSKIAIHYGGGGHLRAAGYTIPKGELEKYKKELLAMLEVMVK